uniref:Uncharacterized protein n=1 Tax=Cucumis melo TaxID=3656 RepID=A0A9I9E9N2_CUCME
MVIGRALCSHSIATTPPPRSSTSFSLREPPMSSPPSGCFHPSPTIRCLLPYRVCLC